jgi:superfamily II helicase
LIADRARFSAVRKLEKTSGVRLPDFAFHGAFLEKVSTAIDYEHLDRKLRQQLLNFFQDFLRCGCRDSPLCGCPERLFALRIIELRETGLDHRQISAELLDEYGIEIYPADILGFLEDSVHVLEAVRDVAELEGEEAMAQDASVHIGHIAQ